MGRFISRKVSY